jgi:hypothetical protein
MPERGYSAALRDSAHGGIRAKRNRHGTGHYKRDSSRSFAYFTTGYTAERKAQRNPG